MTAAERSLIGLAQQSGAGSPNENDDEFVYVLFRNGGVAVQNVTIPLDPEVGGGAMLRDVVRVGVTSGGALDIIPRPASLGWFLKGALGKCESTTGAESGAYVHTFTLPEDQFDAPYFTVRASPGGMWFEQMQDCRVAGLALTFAGARFVDGAVTFVGGLPEKLSDASGAKWSGADYVDGGPQFISPISSIELPSGAGPAEGVKVLSGSVAFGLAIPLDEQWIVGSYSPDDFAINQRSMMINLNLKIDDEELYEKMVYDPESVSGAADWTANVFREGDIVIHLESPTMIEGCTGTPYSLDIICDAANDNIVWSAAPIGLRAGRNVIMAITGMVLASASGPVTVTLTNGTESYSGPS
jgi:hypothetical protein